MITKERLEELITKSAMIYYADRDVQFPVPIFLNEEDFVRGKELSHEGSYIRYIPLEDLYEEHKDVEWVLKYHATRTEELDLPMWEDWQRVNKTGLYAMSFRDKKYHYCELMVFHDEIKVTKQAYGLEVLFDEPATEENYIKACDLCLKLFEGEENVD